jgi:peptide-methionine (S)-S-oxide reductase
MKTLFSLLLGGLLMAQATDAIAQTEEAIFAGGCFWCIEHDLEVLDGVKEVVSGYTGGHVENPTYQQVSAGQTGHFEAVKVTYDPQVISYQTLLDNFWFNVDPLDAAGQFCDKGDQYRSAIFYQNEEQKKRAEESLQVVEVRLGAKVATQILPASTFYLAEGYHQNYSDRNPLRYKFYRYNCGRDKRLNELWGNSKS